MDDFRDYLTVRRIGQVDIHAQDARRPQARTLLWPS
jgi:hypothetical protein